MIDLQHLPGSSLQEENIHLLRAHGITLIPLIATGLIVLALPILGYWSFTLYDPIFFTTEWHYVLYLLGSSIFFLYSLLFLFQAFIDYWLDVFIVTDRRILNIKQFGLFHRTVSELRMSRIQDVTSEHKGILHTIFNYGNIYIQTAGEVERFAFKNVGKPQDIAKMILEMSEKDRKSHLDEAVEEFGIPNKISTK